MKLLLCLVTRDNGVVCDATLPLREYKTSMDNLEFVTAWLRSGIPNARVAMKWSGLQMEGASFDGSRLLHNSHDSPSITVAPVCTVAWIPKVSILAWCVAPIATRDL